MWHRPLIYKSIAAAYLLILGVSITIGVAIFTTMSLIRQNEGELHGFDQLFVIVAWFIYLPFGLPSLIGGVLLLTAKWRTGAKVSFLPLGLGFFLAISFVLNALTNTSYDFEHFRKAFFGMSPLTFLLPSNVIIIAFLIKALSEKSIPPIDNTA